MPTSRQKVSRGGVHRFTSRSYLGNNGIDHNHPTDLLLAKKHRLISDLKRKAEDLTVNVPAAVDQGIASLGLSHENMVTFPLPKTVGRYFCWFSQGDIPKFRTLIKPWPMTFFNFSFYSSSRLSTSVQICFHHCQMIKRLKYRSNFRRQAEVNQLLFMMATRKNTMDDCYYFQLMICCNNYVKRKSFWLTEHLEVHRSVLTKLWSLWEWSMTKVSKWKVLSWFRFTELDLFSLCSLGVPLAWALTSNRQQQTYDKIWSVMIKWSLKKQSPMKVKRFILDFEAAQRNSIERHVGVETTFLAFVPLSCSYEWKYSMIILPFLVCGSRNNRMLVSFLPVPV